MSKLKVKAIGLAGASTVALLFAGLGTACGASFLVYDLDSDGSAELIVKTAPGTRDGKGDGAELATIAYHAPYSSGSFGDTQGNRAERYNASIAFLDPMGKPSAVMQRGYYGRTTFGAYDHRDGQLKLVWKFDTQDAGNQKYARRGFARRTRRTTNRRTRGFHIGAGMNSASPRHFGTVI
jgi:hypothetical protein